MIMSDELKAALLYANASTEQLRGFGPTDADAMRHAVWSGRVTWVEEEGATWQDIASDAKRAGILTFVSTPHGVLVLDNN